jgi:hypothetical protein
MQKIWSIITKRNRIFSKCWIFFASSISMCTKCVFIIETSSSMYLHVIRVRSKLQNFECRIYFKLTWFEIFYVIISRNKNDCMQKTSHNAEILEQSQIQQSFWNMSIRQFVNIHAIRCLIFMLTLKSLHAIFENYKIFVIENVSNETFVVKFKFVFFKFFLFNSHAKFIANDAKKSSSIFSKFFFFKRFKSVNNHDEKTSSNSFDVSDNENENENDNFSLSKTFDFRRNFYENLQSKNDISKFFHTFKSRKKKFFACNEKKNHHF